MVYIFSSQTQRILSRAGWFPARHISIQSYIDILEAEGYVVFPVVSTFLHEFGGLYLTPTWLDHLFRRHEIAEFDAGRAAKGIFIETVQWYEAYLGRQLCVIANRYTPAV